MVRKIETLAGRAELSSDLERDVKAPTLHGRMLGASAGVTRRGATKKKKSVYVGEGSDAKDYRYKSDFDDTSDGGV